MSLRRSKATKAKEAVTEPIKTQVTDRTDDLMAALEAAREAIARASNAASRKGAELGKEASKAADKLLPERAKQRRREAARRRNRRLLAGAAGLGTLALVLSRLSGPRSSELRQGLKRQAEEAGGGWDRAPESGLGTEPASPAEVTQLRGNGAGGDPARTPPS